MLILKASAVIAAVLLMSPVSAQAMEFDDRPDLISAVSSPSTVRAMPTDDRSRRQIDNHIVLLPVTVAETKLANRPRPVSNLIQARVAHMIFGDRPGRLSVEFSAVSKGSGIRFENRSGVVSNRFKPIASPIAMRFENRPGPISNRLKTLAARSEDRPGFTSSLSKATTPLEVQARLSSVEICVWSVAACDPLSFAQRPGIGIRSAAHVLFAPSRSADNMPTTTRGAR